MLVEIDKLIKMCDKTNNVYRLDDTAVLQTSMIMKKGELTTARGLEQMVTIRFLCYA